MIQDLKNKTYYRGCLLSYRIRLVALLFLCLMLLMSGCGKKNPNPVEKKEGMVFIPIDDTAFLIPEKTWLKSYANNSTDGSVCCFTLHATIPDVQPWSEARHDEMYWGVGPGKKIRITVTGNQAYLHKHFYEVPHSTMYSSKFIEEPSDQTAQGLRQFRKLNVEINEDEFKQLVKTFGKELVITMKENSGSPRKDMIYYEKIENDRVKYFISCSESKLGLFQGCNLRFLWSISLEVDIYFIRRNITHIVSMADKVVEKLEEFEGAGLAYQTKYKLGE